MQWLADRFFLAGKRWIDAASGVPVRILLEEASDADAFDWDEQCARMMNARHPLLNQLLDYGPAPDGRRFEAYAAGEEVPAAGGAGERALLHATEFLRASGITPSGARCAAALRAVSADRGDVFRPIGYTLQPRQAFDAVREALDCSSCSGALVISVAGPQRAGLQTFRTSLARAARLQGFVPVSAALFGTGCLDALLHERHVCVFDDAREGGRRGRDVAARLIDMASKSARRHVLVRFSRERRSGSAIPLDPLSIRALVGMVFRGAAESPSEEELFAAARTSEGRPGLFVARLQGTAYSTSPRSVLMVHETAPAYGVERAPSPATPDRRQARGQACSLRAVPRARALALKGRHAAALRVLRRAARVLSGRGQIEEGGAALVAAGRLALARGRTGEAAALFEEARFSSAAGTVAFSAAAGVADAWIDDSRFMEAEALLRGTLAAADTVGDARGASVAAAGLVRVLYFRERFAEAVALASSREWTTDGDEPSTLLIMASRCHAALGRIPPALRLARAARLAADESASAARVADAALALAEVLGGASDIHGMKAELDTAAALARSAHLPLVFVHARIIEAEYAADRPADRARLQRELGALDRLPLPSLLRQRLSAARTRLARSPAAHAAVAIEIVPDARREAADALEALLQACQHAADDPAAVAAVCAGVVDRLQAASAMVLSAGARRVLAVAGRPWVAHSTVAAQALASGMPAATEAGCEPREAAEPVRYGGEVVAVLGCRWTAGIVVDGYGAAAVLRAAALAVAAPVRAVLDRAVPPPPPGTWGDLLGDSAPATALRDSVMRAARAPFPVLVEGESGSGKELVARAIHRLSARRDRRFCAINCAALTDELVEAELFGHARGAFTGAATERAGLFEEADGGTLFLDEVGELSARAQAKLLRVLQEGEVRRVGENFSRRVDARIVAATNRRLEDEVAAGRFRADLRFRLDVVRITVPPLRERTGDIPMLAAHFWNDASTRVGSNATLTGDALAALARHDWPGNVRELQNVVAWMAVHSPRRGRIGPSALPEHVVRAAVTAGACSFEAARDEFERRMIRAALAGANGQRAKAAQALGITRQGLAKMMRRLRIEVSS